MNKIKEIENIIKRETEYEDAVILKGKEAMKAMQEHFEREEEYTESLRIAYHDKTQEVAEKPKEIVLGLYGYRDDEYYAIILPRDMVVDPSAFLFVSEFIPFVYCEWVNNKCPNIQKMLLDEYTKACDESYKVHKAPLFVTGSRYEDMMLAWDVQDKNFVTIKGYKTYRQSFIIIYSDGKVEADEGRYYIYIPSEKFRLLTGIWCNPEYFESRQRWEGWEKTPFHIPDGQIPELIKDKGLSMDIYQRALNFVNASHRENKGAEICSILEDRVCRLERMLLIDTPDYILKETQRSVEKALNELE